MVTALVMLNVDRKHIRNVSQSLVDMKEVSEAVSYTHLTLPTIYSV